MLFRALAVVFLCAAAPAQPAPDLKAEFQTHWKQARYLDAERTLTVGFTSDKNAALTLARSLIETGSDAARPLGAAAFAAHASPAELAALASKLGRTTHPDERRLFVRSIGRHAASKSETAAREVKDAAGPFVSDPDLCVAAAAIRALADTRDPAAIGLFIDRLIDIPSRTNSPPDGDRGILSRAAAGALESLSGRTFTSVPDAKAWWKKTQGKDTPRKPAPGAAPETGTYGGQTYFITDRFHVFYRIGRSTDAPAEGDLSLAALAPMFGRATESAVRSLEPVVGIAYVPALRLYLCDPQQFNAKAGMASFAGVTSGNEIILKADVPRALPMTLWHEYIHAIHDSTYANQPRWLSEGLAMSYTLSAKGAMKRDRAEADLKNIIERGGFSEMLNWNSGGSGDAKECARYATAHLCIDYLRFAADRGAPDTRLAFVMGRISRRQGARQAIEAVYGMSIRELDAGLRELAGP